MSTKAIASTDSVDEFRARMQTRTVQVGIVGLGYVGLPLALLFSEQRFRLTGFDIDHEKVHALNDSRSYIHRILPTEVAAARANGFSATNEYAKAAEMDAMIICVPTPLNEYREPDLSYIEKTAHAIAPHLRAGQLIVLESTTFPGPTEEVLVPILEKGNKLGLKAARTDQEDASKTFLVAFSPEREDPGNDTVARKDIPKVVGGLSPAASQIAGAVYNAIFNRVVPVSSPAVAEMTKLLENIYRCVNIALVNELKLLSQRMGIDIWEVIDAAATKPFGFMPFCPGPGPGGHCIPVDPYYLSWKAREYDFSTRFIELAGEVNTAMPYHVVDAVANSLNDHKKSMKGSKILVLGVAYKKDVDDLRESPTLKIMQLLQQRGAQLDYNDPYFPKLHKMRHYNYENMKSVPLNPQNIGGYDAVIVATEHSSYDYGAVVDAAKLVIDTRNATRRVVRHREKIVLC